MDTVDRIRHELAKLYRDARDGDRDTADFSRLANGLAIIARLLEGGELRQRVEVIEQKLEDLAAPRRRSGHGSRSPRRSWPGSPTGEASASATP